MVAFPDAIVTPIMVYSKKVFFLFFISMILAPPLCAQDLSTTESPLVNVLYDKPLEFAAGDVIGMYPGIKDELEAAMLWPIDFQPTVVLINKQERFSQMAGNSAYVAYALPKKQLIVIDYSRMNIRPFTLRITLKHELCHLLLHRHITKVHLPKWLDEGVAQWASDGISEIMTGRNTSVVRWATLTGRFIRLDALAHHFPGGERDLVLAYEQSKLLVEYIIANFGRNGVLNILEAMKGGHEADQAVAMSLMMSTADLEQAWQRNQRSWSTVLAYLAANIYTIVFICAASLTTVLYIRAVFRRRRYADEEEDEDYSRP
jgi:hypothetical protein